MLWVGWWQHHWPWKIPPMQPVLTAMLMRRCNANYIAQWRESRASLNATGRRHWASICMVLSIVPKCSCRHVANMSENPTCHVSCWHPWQHVFAPCCRHFRWYVANMSAPTLHVCLFGGLADMPTSNICQLSKCMTLFSCHITTYPKFGLKLP